MGQTMETLLEQNSHVADVRAQVGLAVAAIATQAASGGGTAGRQQRRAACPSTRR